MKPAYVSPTRWLGCWLWVLALPVLAGAESGDPPPYYFGTLAGQSSPGSTDGVGSIARFSGPAGVAVDAAGNLYVADQANHTIRKVTPAGLVTTLAGRAGYPGRLDGPGTDARFKAPTGIAVDAAGNVYVADTYNHAIRRIAPDGIVTTWAGRLGFSDHEARDGPGDAARFNSPEGLAIDATGTLYVADSGNACIRKISPGREVTTLAGAPGIHGHADGAGSAARFNYPRDLAVDRAGIIYVTEWSQSTVRRISPDGTVATLGGPSGTEWTGIYFQSPSGLAVDAAGTVYLSDNNHTIRRITVSGADVTWAGNSQSAGSADGPGGTARFRYPAGLAVDGNGNVFVADAGNNTLRKITPGAEVTTLAGIGLENALGAADGPPDAARFRQLSGIALGPAGEIYVADPLNDAIRRVSASGDVTTVAAALGLGFRSRSTTDLAAPLQFGVRLATDRAGNVYFADSYNRTVRKISPGGIVTTLIQGSIFDLFSVGDIAVDSAGNVYFTDNRAFGHNFVRKISPDGTVSLFASNETFAAGEYFISGRRALTAIAIDAADNIYVAYTGDPGYSGSLGSFSRVETDGVAYWTGAIKKISPTGVVTSVAGGSGSRDNFSDGPAATAGVGSVSGLSVDASGRVFFTDDSFATVRVVTPAGNVSTIGGKHVVYSYSPADGVGDAARFLSPLGLTVDATGKLFILDGSTLRLGEPAGPPVITLQPQSLTVSAGSSVRFSVATSGAPEPVYQWFHDGSPFAGATTNTLSFTNARASDAGEYTVTATNTLGSATSSKAVLTVTAAPAPPPAPTPSAPTSGGGGATSLWFYAILLLLGARRKFRA